MLLGDTHAFNTLYSYKAICNRLLLGGFYTLTSLFAVVLALAYTNAKTNYMFYLQFSLLAFVMFNIKYLWTLVYRVQQSRREAVSRLGHPSKPFNFIDKVLYKLNSRNLHADVVMEVVKLGESKYALVKLTEGYYVGGHVLESATPSAYIDTYDKKYIIGCHKFEDTPKFFMVKKTSPRGVSMLHTIDEFHRNREEVAPMVAGAIVSKMIEVMQGENE